jgi:hypothetical protein
MPLNSLTVDDEVLIVSEMPLDKVTATIGNVNGTASKLLGFYWTGSWVAFTDEDGVQSDGSLLIDDCSDFGSWADGDAGNGVSSQVAFQGRQTFKLLGGVAGAGNSAKRTQDVGSFAAGCSITMRCYHDLLGTQANNDEMYLSFDDGTNQCKTKIDSNGFFVSDGAAWNEVGTDIVTQDEWVEWTWKVASDFQTVDIYKNGTLVEAAVDCSAATGSTDGNVTFEQKSVTTDNQLTYVDIIRIGDGGTETGDGFSDGTESSNATMAQTGNITWTARSDEEKTDVQGVPGFAYKFKVAVALDSSVSVTGLTAHSPMAPVRSVWDGFYEFVSGCYVNDGTDNTDYTAYVNNIVESQFMDLAGVTTTDKIYVGFPQRVNKIIFYPAADGKNTGNVSITAVKYHNASGAATSVGTVTDTMETNNATFSQKGYLAWSDPGWTNEKMTIIGGDLTPMYWYEITVDAALDDPTSIYYIQGVPIPKDPDPSYGVFAFKRRWIR